MSKIDVKNWKSFHLYNLFKIDSGNKFDRRKVTLTDEPHNINFIGRTGEHNGINATCGIYKNTKPYPAGCLTVALGGTIGATFLQDSPFYTSQNVIVLIPNKYKQQETNNVKQFIASCIFYESQLNYRTFAKELNKHIKRDFIIKLPVTTSGTPDWSYMDTYISTMTQKARFELKELKKPTKESPKLDIKKWKEFKISNLFELNHGKRIKRITLDTPGKIDYLTAGQENQGVLMSVKKQTLNQQTLNTYKSVITIDMFGNCFYHPEIVSGDDNIYFLTNKKISESAKLFITAVLSHKLYDSFGYTNQFRQRYFNKISIPLPVTTSDTPDWHYMDTYISALKHRAQQQIKITKKMK